MKLLETIIVGAGVSGLACAKMLKNAGKDVLLLDKGRRPGGRVATTKLSGTLFDHGAQFFTARSDVFKEEVKRATAAGAVKEWRNVFAAHDYPRFGGTAGINDLPKYLAQGLDVLVSTHVTAITCDKNGWLIQERSGERYRAKRLVVTPPVPQTVALFANCQEVDIPVEIAQIEYYKSLAILVAGDEPLTLPDEVGAVRRREHEISWIADNRHKGIAKSLSCALTIQCSYDFSEKYFEADEHELYALVQEKAADLVRLPQRPKAIKIQRWRYAEPKTVFSKRYIRVDAPHPLYLCGEVFGGPKIEGAYLSGHELGHLLRDS